MGEIIPIDFKNQKIINKKEASPDKETRGEEENNFNLLLKFLKFSVTDAAGILMSLRTSRTTLAEAQNLVKEYTTQELMNWLENSTERDWTQKTGFFQAVFLELKFRLTKK